jgi:GntR family transcriptional regulator
LRRQILSGDLRPDDRIPTEHELEQLYSVSRNTVRKATRELIAEGHLVTDGRRGTRVRRPLPFVYDAQIYGDQSYYAEPNSLGDSWTAQVLSAGRVPSQSFEMYIGAVGPSAGSRLGLDPDTLVCHRVSERSVDDVRWCDETSYYPMDVAEACGLNTPHDIPEGAARRLSSKGFVEIRYQDRIHGRRATPEELSDFELPSGSSVIIHDRLAMLADRPIRLTRYVFPMERNEIAYEWRASRS